jgi:soluble lytic murein transglycosylase-like protein
MTIDDLIKITKATATAHGIDPALLCALVEHESSWDVWAMRYEPDFYDRYVKPLTGMSITEKTARSTSFGLTQCMGQVARELGFTQKWLSELCDPVTGLEYGARKLKKCLDAAAGSTVVALLRYNGGGDASYADAVLKLVGKYK